MRQQGVDEALGIRTERQAEQGAVGANAVATSLRASGVGVTESNLTTGTRASRATTTGSLAGDEFFETDTSWRYRWTGTTWAYTTGVYAATDATRTALTLTTEDNGAWFYATDTRLWWQVVAGSWTHRDIAAGYVRESSGPTSLAVGAVSDGQFLKRSGSTVVGDTPAAGTTLPAADTTAVVKGSSDATKLLRFEVDGFTTTTTRVVTPPDADTRLPVATQTLTFSGPTAARTLTLPDANFSVARIDAAQTFVGVQTFSGNILSSSDGGITIGAAAANRPNAYLFGLNIGNTGSISAGTFKLAATTNGIQMQSGFLQLGSGVGLGWSSGDVFSAAEDTRIKRAKAAVVEFNAASVAGGTFRTVALTPAQITADQNNYNPGGVSMFQRWSSDASRNVTGLSISQVDGEIHTIFNVGSNNIVLVNESASSTAANRFKNSTGADITLAANQAADVVYDNTQSRWLVFKRN